MLRLLFAVLAALMIISPALAANPAFNVNSPSTATVGVSIQQAGKVKSQSFSGRGQFTTTIPTNYTINSTTVLENTTGLTIQCSTAGQVVVCRSNGNMPVDTHFKVGINLTPISAGTATSVFDFSFQYNVVPPVPNLYQTINAVVVIS